MSQFDTDHRETPHGVCQTDSLWKINLLNAPTDSNLKFRKLKIENKYIFPKENKNKTKQKNK